MNSRMVATLMRITHIFLNNSKALISAKMTTNIHWSDNNQSLNTTLGGYAQRTYTIVTPLKISFGDDCGNKTKHGRCVIEQSLFKYLLCLPINYNNQSSKKCKPSEHNSHPFYPLSHLFTLSNHPNLFLFPLLSPRISPLQTKYLFYRPLCFRNNVSQCGLRWFSRSFASGSFLLTLVRGRPSAEILLYTCRINTNPITEGMLYTTYTTYFIVLVQQFHVTKIQKKLELKVGTHSLE